MKTIGSVTDPVQYNNEVIMPFLMNHSTLSVACAPTLSQYFNLSAFTTTQFLLSFGSIGSYCPILSIKRPLSWRT